MRISDWSSDVCSSDLPCRRKATAHETSSIPPWRRPAGRRFGGAASAVRCRSGAVLHHHRVLDVLRRPRLPQHRRQHHDLQRSEEHTSELQSLMRISYAVFCLKKKTTSTKTNQLI